MYLTVMFSLSKVVVFQQMQYIMLRDSPSITTIVLIVAENTGMCVRPEGLWSGCWWVFTFPVEIVLFLTVPNCRKRRRLYPFTFLMCIVWIGISSYIISWMVTIVGKQIILSATFICAKYINEYCLKYVI